jgi:hypothetical protein
MFSIVEKDKQERICRNRKNALDDQSPKHCSQRVFPMSPCGRIVMIIKRCRNDRNPRAGQSGRLFRTVQDKNPSKFASLTCGTFQNMILDNKLGITDSSELPKEHEFDYCTKLWYTGKDD